MFPDNDSCIPTHAHTRTHAHARTHAGPNRRITKEEADNDRLLHSNYFSGRGIVIWKGSHIKIHHNIVHDCPNSGIRVDKGDYCTIEDNVVYNNTWWSSSGESAIVYAEAAHIDQTTGVKMAIKRNTVFGNMNRVPFYKGDGADVEQFGVAHEGFDDYGTSKQTYIIDGSGVYITRNSESYKCVKQGACPLFLSLPLSLPLPPPLSSSLPLSHTLSLFCGPSLSLLRSLSRCGAMAYLQPDHTL